ncbi:tax1-binding protein 1 homolog A [Clupea harengus]|uniref:Tax1-binding protein 1 homolog A n=1 Tax=Clupea harengus TaxID=7950 RepID=A0A6P8H1W9_CLUHA|nr:tax1-binding protein 1 homolog A [Clupea harengus]
MMSSFREVATSPGCGPVAKGSVSIETSSFAHVIFQNVGKSFLPQAPLECHYTLTPAITPHPKDWVGIFKVGWSTARDYYTFLWSPMPESYVEGSTVHRVIVFQGYYVPRSDGEFYQFCYVTHGGEIRGASTPFQFRQATPSGEELLTVEDEGNSDILVVTTKTGLLEQRVCVAQQECMELQQRLCVLQREKEQVQADQRRLQRERDEERDTYAQIHTHNKELLHLCEAEREELRKRLHESKERTMKLEEEQQLVRDKLHKVTLEKDSVESHLKAERAERDLHKAHVRSAELENTKLTAELQMLKAMELNREVTIAQYQEELQRLHTADIGEAIRLKEHLQQAEEKLQCSQQEAVLLGADLCTASSRCEQTAGELQRVRQEAEALRSSLSEAQAQGQSAQSQLERMRHVAYQKEGGDSCPVSQVEAELHKEVDELKVRLQMAAEHYKEKYRECQKLRKQVKQLSQQPRIPPPESPDQVESDDAKRIEAEMTTEMIQETSSPSPEMGAADKLFTAQDATPTEENTARERGGRVGEETRETEGEHDGNGENREDDHGDGEILESEQHSQGEEERREEEEGAELAMIEEEEGADLAMVEETWREQCSINKNFSQLLKAQLDEKSREVTALRESLSDVMREKERLEKELRLYGALQRPECSGEQVALLYPLPYTQEHPPPPLIQQRPADLQYGNPYARDPVDGASGSSGVPGPEGVVCMQPSRGLSIPDGLENVFQDPRQVRRAHTNRNIRHTTYSLIVSAVQKRCPLCEVIFPPQFEQRSFEQHVEAHWRVCPVCSEQFPLHTQQLLYERHVLTHFDGNVLNFE